MATVPATIPAGAPATSPATAPAVAPQGLPSNNLMAGLSGLHVMRQVGLLVGLAASIALGFWVVLWSQEPDYSPLLSNINNIDATQAVDVLRANNIPHRMETRTGALMVASEHLHTARMKLAEVGIADRNNVGFELLDKEQGLGTSQFMENISYRRGLEGEMARTIASLNSVRSARVHLAIPKATVFVRDARKPRASVFVELMAGRRLRDEQVNAIVSLVASSVPELETADVTVVDQNGRLLSQQGQSESAAMAAHQFEYTRKLEETMIKRVRRILEPIVGMNNFNAEVSADVDFTAIEQTEEVFNPDLSALRSEQTLEEQRSAGGPGAGGVPGALSNQPPGAATVPEQVADAAAGAAPGAGAATPGNSRTQATRNYELDRTISYTRHQQGRLQRLSVAVVVDNVVPSDGSTEEPAPWPQEDLERLTQLVQGAIGYDVARGDTVTVINAAFAALEQVDVALEDTPIWETPMFQKMVKQGLAVVLVLILVFAVIRPIMKSLSNVGEQQKQLQEATANANAAAQAANNPQAMSPPPAQAVGAGANPALLSAPGGGYGSQLSTVQGMIADDPARAAQVVKQWVADE